VRLEAAKRLEPQNLEGLLSDPDWRIRYEIAKRAGLDVVAHLAADEDPLVREYAGERLASAGMTSPVIVVRKRSDP
jgi:hypothetical protein